MFVSKEITYKVNSNGCWNCTSHSPNRDGYPRILYKRKRIYIHRYMYLTRIGPIPEGLVVRHKCDNPICINPDHLEIGTQADNIHDMIRRGRANFSQQGIKNPKARLTEKDVMDIRNRYRNGERQADIAKCFGISRYLVFDVIKRKWKHLNEGISV